MKITLHTAWKCDRYHQGKICAENNTTFALSSFLRNAAFFEYHKQLTAVTDGKHDSEEVTGFSGRPKTPRMTKHDQEVQDISEYTSR